ncbi:MAG: head GIN domain-containing protein [Bacteroidales bacterium]
MKTKHLIFAAVASLCLLITGSAFVYGQLPSEERKVPSFTGIGIAVAGEVFLVQGPTQKLVVEGSERVLSDLITEVRGNKLTVRLPNRWNFRRNDELRIYITMPEINEISLSGSARLTAESPIEADRMSVAISGSGRVEIDDFEASQLDVSISGSGRLNLGGSRGVGDSRIAISGSGRYESSTMPSEKVSATISGSGSCRVYALSDLNVRISGSGNVIYTGQPLIDARISGSGKVVNNN